MNIGTGSSSRCSITPPARIEQESCMRSYQAALRKKQKSRVITFPAF
jgi:hypothetical protein